MKAKPTTLLNRLQKEYRGKEGVCPKCGKLKEITVDHIIPAHFLESIGLYDEAVNDGDNFELMCYWCNKYKGGRIDLANPKTVPLLKKYINQI